MNFFSILLPNQDSNDGKNEILINHGNHHDDIDNVDENDRLVNLLVTNLTKTLFQQNDSYKNSDLFELIKEISSQNHHNHHQKQEQKDLDDVVTLSHFAIYRFWPWQFLLIVLYSLTALVSFSLNILTIIVWLRSNRFITNEIWRFLINLSVADIGMSLLCIPFTYTNVMWQQWIFPNELCSIVNFAQQCFVMVSVWTMTLIAIDRYFAILYPLRMSNSCFRLNKMIVICLIWFGAILLASPQFWISKSLTYINQGHELYECREVWSDDVHAKWYSISVFFITFGGPILIILFVYANISYRMIKQVTPGNPDSIRDLAQMKRKHKVFKILMTVVALFGVCWGPLQFFNILVDFFPSLLNFQSVTTLNLYYVSFFVTHFLAMMHSLVNPIVYCFLSESFRKNFWKLIWSLTNGYNGGSRRRSNLGHDNTRKLYRYKRRSSIKLHYNDRERHFMVMAVNCGDGGTVSATQDKNFDFEPENSLTPQRNHNNGGGGDERYYSAILDHHYHHHLFHEK